MRSLSLKLGLIYLFLALLNISFFTIIIFENQMDILTENTQYKAEKTADDIYAQLTILTRELNQLDEELTEGSVVNRIKEKFNFILAAGSDSPQDPGSDKVNPLTEKLKKLLNEFAVIKEQGDVLFHSNPAFTLTETHQNDVVSAVTNYEFMGQVYFSKVNNENNEILFYLPVPIENLDQLVLFFKMDMEDMTSSLAGLYRMVVLIIVVIALFHVGFAFILHRLIISPIKTLAGRSADISKGDYAARVKIKSSDEIGYLGQSFNAMAESIENTISELNAKNAIMRKELQMAAQVQKSIYPSLRKTRYFDLAVYHKPLYSVSGDYHNIIDLGDGRYGIIVADVSGHGVSAALITMMIKDRFDELAPEYKDSRKLMEQMNLSFQHLMDDFDKFFTAFYLIIDKNRIITFSNAAHPRALVVRPGKKAFKALDTEGGVFIGFPFSGESEYSSRRVRLAAGDKVLLYTDGIIEARSRTDEIYGDERFQRNVIKYTRLPCDLMLKEILKEFHVFSSLENRRDDETLIILEMKE